MEPWLAENWFNLISTVGIVGSLWVAIITIRAETKSRQVSNQLAITANHREIWKDFGRSSHWKRVTNPRANLEKRPVTPAEEVFVGMVIAHVNTVFYATKNGLVIAWEHCRRDVEQFMSLPVPNEVWKRLRPFQNDEFVDFVESTLAQL